MSESTFLICSIPKAGTYLAGAILKHMGLKDTGMHLMPGHRVVDYSLAPTLEVARALPKAWQRLQPHDEIFASMRPGEFASCHLGPLVRAMFDGRVKAIWVQRNLRDCIVSYCRWDIKRQKWAPETGGLTQAEMLLRWWEKNPNYITAPLWCSVGWATVPHELTVHFSALVGQLGVAAQVLAFAEIARLVGWKGDIAAAIAATVGKETLTWSGRISRWKEWWSERMEMWFEEAGLKLANDYLGYE